MLDLQAIESDAADRGKAAGTWVFDGNTAHETYVSVLRMYDGGDPQLYDIIEQPEWLSGEWAGESIPELIDDFDEMSDVEQSEAMDAYECAASQAFWDEVIRTASYQVGC